MTPDHKFSTVHSHSSDGTHSSIPFYVYRPTCVGRQPTKKKDEPQKRLLFGGSREKLVYFIRINCAAPTRLESFLASRCGRKAGFHLEIVIVDSKKEEIEKRLSMSLDICFGDTLSSRLSPDGEFHNHPNLISIFYDFSITESVISDRDSIHFFEV